MRPINLKLQAFGPFRDKIEIDFSKFSEKGLFLLTGVTGSGKTTIFDAISYALFDCTSGNIRNKDNVRSDYASADIKTYVELSFMHNNKIYNITRYPSYNRDGYKTKTVADASIAYDDKIIMGSTNVTKEVSNILGIDSKQFKQIAMIAQGEFQNLLFASSNERTIIFRNIFDTSIYSKVSENLKNKFLAINREYKNKQLIFDNEITNIDWDETVDDNDDILEKLSLAVEKDKTLVENINKKTDFLTNNISILNNKLSLAKIANENLKNKEEKKLRYNDLLLDSKKYKDLKRNIEKQKVIMPLFENKINLDKKILKIQDNLNKNELLLDECNTVFEKTKLKYNNVDKLKTELQTMLKIINIIENNNLINEKLKKIILIKPEDVDLNKINELEKNIFNDNSLSLYEKEKLIYKQDKEELEKLKITFNKITNNETELNKKLNKLTKIKEEYILLLKEIEDLENILLNNQAAFLALNLNTDEPCLVCGSKIHPNLAKFNDSFNIKDLDSKKILLKQVQEKKETLFNETFALDSVIKESNKEEIENLISKLTVKKYKLDQYKKSYEIYLDNCKNLDLLKIKLKKHDEDLLKYNNNLANIKALEANIVVVDRIYTKKEFESLNCTINEIIDSYNQQLLKINTLNNEIKNQNENIINFNNELSVIKDKIKDEDCWDINKLNMLEKETNDYFLEFNKVETILNDLIERTLDVKKVDVLELEKQLENNKEELSSIDKTIAIRFNNNKKVLEKLKKLKNDNLKIEKIYSNFKILSDTANGTINGKLKINFEQFVQSYYFEEVIKNSNIRLNDITGGRYELVKKKDANLELDVIDYYTGKTRSVKTLSGGEIFKSSLSLALGMSDTIGSYAGGIKIDTLFIDEGFGSLDSDSLESAINTLTELSSDKLIGIISHVEELKNRIDKKIIVTPSNEGSSVNIEV